MMTDKALLKMGCASLTSEQPAEAAESITPNQSFSNVHVHTSARSPEIQQVRVALGPCISDTLT